MTGTIKIFNISISEDLSQCMQCMTCFQTALAGCPIESAEKVKQQDDALQFVVAAIATFNEAADLGRFLTAASIVVEA